ncbi:hypothetical protein ACFE04_012211 [Oxalis oulophora]
MAAVRKIFLLLLTLLLSLSTLSHCQTEVESLLQLKKSFTNGDVLNSWLPNTDPCKDRWVGIVCSPAGITGLRLSGLGLSGNIDVEAILNIKSLRTISFVNNKFSGPIPDFRKLGAIKALFLTGNQFSGEIPNDYFSQMLSLKKLWIDENKFTGKIPDSVMQLPRLTELHLEANQFSGPLPEIKTPEIMASLDLSSNQLEGQIPASYARFGADSFEKNDKLCGKPLPNACPVAGEAATTQDPGAPPEAPSDDGSNMLVYVAIAAVVAFVVILLVSKKRNKDDNFSILSKDDYQEMVEVHVPETPQRKTESSTKKSNSSKRGGSTQGGKSGVTDLIMVNDEKEPFGLADLMKAAAEVLGNGGLGSAYKAVMANGLSVVVKRMREMNRLGRDGYDSEMRRYGRLRHQNILSPLAYHYRKEEKLLVSEHQNKGSLLYVLHGDRGTFHAELNWPTRLKIVKGIVNGLSFLHQEYSTYELPHGNLKSCNVILKDDYEPLLSDYAFLPLVNPNHAPQALFAFKCPEYVERQHISHKSDIYCLGIIILEILTGKFPSQYVSNNKGGMDVVEWVHTTIAENKEEELIDPEIAGDTNSMEQMVKLLRVGAACTEKSPEQRLDMKQTIRRIEEVQGAQTRLGIAGVRTYAQLDSIPVTELVDSARSLSQMIWTNQLLVRVSRNLDIAVVRYEIPGM